MYCPDCGTENSRGQKFCTRCGTNLLVVDYARSLTTDINAQSQNANAVTASTVLKIVTIISVIGFICTLLGTIVLSNIYDRPDGAPIGLFFAVAAFIALVVIIKQLLKLISTSAHKQTNAVPPQTNIIQLPTASRTTNPTLGEGTQQPYYSVVEERTRQLENQ